MIGLGKVKHGVGNFAGFEMFAFECGMADMYLLPHISHQDLGVGMIVCRLPRLRLTVSSFAEVHQLLVLAGKVRLRMLQLVPLPNLGLF